MQVSAGKGGTVFDEDPKRWRLIAEGFTTTGRALEIATAVFPQNFVVLAGGPASLSCSCAVITGSSHVIFAINLWQKCF